MANGANDWGVTFGRISFLDGIIQTHPNVRSVTRAEDILFTINREDPADTLRILCADEYAFGMPLVRRALAEFEQLHIIYVGGAWNGYTKEAKDFCLEASIGLYNATEMAGGLWRKDYWNYHKKDDQGNPSYHYKAA